MASLFGWQFRKENIEAPLTSFVPKEHDDGAMVVAGGSYGTYVDLDGSIRTEAELVSKYREMALHPEVDNAIDEVVNDSISTDDDYIVKIILDDLPYNDVVKKAIEESFDEVLDMLNFNNQAYEIYRRFYVDGRLYYHAVIDENDPTAGIKEIRYIDPRKIRKIREVLKRPARGQINVSVENGALDKLMNEYYIFNDKGFNIKGNTNNGPGVAQGTTGLKIAPDAIIQVTSGLTNTDGTLVLSYLQKAIRPLTQLRTMEDSLIVYRLARAPERRVWYIDVGNLPKAKAEQYVRDIMTKHKNRLVYDSETGAISDTRKYMCLDMNTKVPLLDGRELSITEITEERLTGKELWAYSCNPETGEILPGLITWSGKTRENAQVVRLTLDNGETITCTPDHKFPVLGKGFVEAQNLLLNESMIPLYRDTNKVTNNGNEYERVFQNNTKEWIFTHRLVSKWKNDNKLREEFVFNNKYLNEEKRVIHHFNYNRFDNTPYNLKMMDHRDHREYHISTASIKYPDILINAVLDYIKNGKIAKEIIILINNDKGLLNAWIEFNKENNTNTFHSKLKFRHRNVRKIAELLKFNTFQELYQFYNEIIVDGIAYPTYNKAMEVHGRGKLNRVANPNLAECGSVEWKQKLSITRKENNIPSPTTKTWKVTCPDGKIEIIKNITKFCRDRGFYSGNLRHHGHSRGYKAEEVINHKIVNIEWIDEKIDVGTLTIDGKELYHDFHTFALSAGIFTKNSMLDDYWLPRRADSKGTEVTTLAGGQNLSQMDDVVYFQKYLYSCLNVPVTRLNPDALFSIGRATEISRDEVKFAKFISRLRSKFSMLFTRALGKHLILKQIMSLQEWDAIERKIRYDFAKDGHFTEMKDFEVLAARLDAVQAIQPFVGVYFSNEEVRKKILKQTADDIEEIDAQIAFESENPQYNPPSFMGDDGQMVNVDPHLQGLGNEEGINKTKEDNQNRLLNAQNKYDTLKKKQNRSPQQQSEFHKVTQILAKNGKFKAPSPEKSDIHREHKADKKN